MPHDIYVDSLRHSEIVDHGPDGGDLALCAPDQGTRVFVEEPFTRLGPPEARLILLDTERSGEPLPSSPSHGDTTLTARASTRS